MRTDRLLYTAAIAAALLLPLPRTVALAVGLNDTGQTLCYDADNVGVPCSAAVGGDAGINPRQDARYGRDAQARAGLLTKIGAGAAGFDYTKISNSGLPLPANAVLGAGATDWGCTKDNVTGLTWEIKTIDGLRGKDHRYTWYSTSATNGGNAGSLGGDLCGGTLSAAPYNNQCNTHNFAAAVNAATLCGSSDWRMPTRGELLTLVNFGTSGNASVDVLYFPNTDPSPPVFWTATTLASYPGAAWHIYFGSGAYSGLLEKISFSAARLVRAGQ